LATLLIVVTGFFAKHELENVEQNQQQLWQAIIPRHEIEMELSELNRPDAMLN
jgi:hypothetical protein